MPGLKINFSLVWLGFITITDIKIILKISLVITRKSSYYFQRVLAIAILSVCLSITWVDQSKKVQARITKSSPSAAWKTLVSGAIKLIHKFEGGHPERER